MGNQKYSAKFKFQVVLEAITSDKADAEIARAYDVHPVTLSNWKTEHRENGAKVFGGDDEINRLQDKVEDLEQLLGKKEVEIALLKNFLGDS
jgi:transposase-like protein